MNPECVRRFKKYQHAIAGPVARLVDSNMAIRVVGGNPSGSLLTDPIRSQTDLMCFGDEADHSNEDCRVAVILDCSGSMFYKRHGCRYLKAAPAAEAFAKVLSRYGTVRRFVFGDHWGEVSGFNRIAQMGGTQLAPPYCGAIRWLEKERSDRRLIVTVMDGVTGDVPTCQALSDRAARLKIGQVCLALDDCSSPCRKALPRAKVIPCSSSKAGIELAKVASSVFR